MTRKGKEVRDFSVFEWVFGHLVFSLLYDAMNGALLVAIVCPFLPINGGPAPPTPGGRAVWDFDMTARALAGHRHQSLMDRRDDH